MFNDNVDFGKKKPVNGAASTEPTFHADYKKNLMYVETFMNNASSNMPKSLSLRLGGSHHKQNDLLWVSVKDPKGPDFAAPVSLHQPNSEVQKQLQHWFNAYHKMAKQISERDEKKPMQQELWEKVA